MKRLAILIQSGLSGDDYLTEVTLDIAGWYRHLISLEGGAWEEDEIILLKNPSKFLFEKTISRAQKADFAIVVFSGHGLVFADESGFPETFVYINDSDNKDESLVPVKNLNPGTPRCILSIDCCRKIAEKPLGKSMSSFSETIDNKRLIYRDYYERVVLNCEKGCCRIYSAGLDECVEDEDSFTVMLMRVAENCKREKRFMTIKEATSAAIKEFAHDNPQQHPSYNGGRRLKHFPFVIGGKYV